MKKKTESLKVLVIAANPFSDINNNGKTLKSIFCEFNKKSLCELYFRPQDNSIGDGEFAESYYAVSESDIINSIFTFSKVCGSQQFLGKSSIVKDTSLSKSQRYFEKHSIKNVKILRRFLWKTRKWDTKDLHEWLDKCSPNLIFSLVGGVGPLFTLSEEISRWLNIPLVVYFTDDYLIHTNDNGVYSHSSHKKNIEAYSRLIGMASRCYCIGTQMCEEYGQFFNTTFFPIMNSVDILPYVPKEKMSNPIIISYFGGLSLGRWEMISRLSEVVKDDAVIKVYTAHEITKEIHKAFDRNNIQFCGKVIGEELEKERQNCDFLLHVENDKKLYREKTALSISTKIPESLMQSRPLLCYGPTEIASMQLIQKNGLGVFISSEKNIQEQRNDFVQAVTDKKKIKDIIENAYQFACNHFDKHVVSKQLKRELTDLVIIHSKNTNDGSFFYNCII